MSAGAREELTPTETETESEAEREGVEKREAAAGVKEPDAERPDAPGAKAPGIPESPSTRSSARRRGSRRRLGRGRPLPYGWALGPLLLLVIWAAGSGTGIIDARNLSAPWTVVTTAGDLIADGRLQSNLATSAERPALGLLFGVVGGLVAALRERLLDRLGVNLTAQEENVA